MTHSIPQVVFHYVDPNGIARCCQPVGDYLCWLTPQHAGRCMSLPHFPQTDIRDHNPAWGEESA